MAGGFFDGQYVFIVHFILIHGDREGRVLGPVFAGFADIAPASRKTVRWRGAIATFDRRPERARRIRGFRRGIYH